MAVSRGGVAFCVGCVRSRRQPISRRTWNQVADLLWIRQSRPLSSASWALSPPNSLRYQSQKPPQLVQPVQQKVAHWEDWDESLSVCVLVQQGESLGLDTLLELPLSAHRRLGDLLPPLRTSDLCFPLTTVDGRREDDISEESLRRHRVDAAQREHGCFRSLFEAERCPAPFMYGSHFYCFHCPGTEPGVEPRVKLGADPGAEPIAEPGVGQKPRPDIRLTDPVELHLLPPDSLCSHAEAAEGEVQPTGDSEREEKLALMYERLRMELPSFFQKRHDFSLYSRDLDFINGLLSTRTRGLGVYQLTVLLWRFLCMCYFADAHLEVLKLTKHLEDGTIKARWRVRGLPAYALLLRFYRRDKSHLYRSYDAFSTFYIGQDGLIHCHKVDKVMPVPPPALPRLPSLLAGALVALGVQDHRPALNLLPLLLSSLRQSRN